MNCSELTRTNEELTIGTKILKFENVGVLPASPAPFSRIRRVRRELISDFGQLTGTNIRQNSDLLNVGVLHVSPAPFSRYILLGSGSGGMD